MKKRGPIDISIDSMVADGSVAKNFDEVNCRKWIINRIHPNGTYCPKCNAKIESEVSIKRFWSGERLRCVYCGSYFNALTGTFCSGMNLSFQEIYCLSLLLALKKDSKTISKYMHISQKTVRLWKAKFDASKKLQGQMSQIDKVNISDIELEGLPTSGGI